MSRLHNDYVKKENPRCWVSDTGDITFDGTRVAYLEKRTGKKLYPLYKGVRIEFMQLSRFADEHKISYNELCDLVESSITLVGRRLDE